MNVCSIQIFKFFEIVSTTSMFSMAKRTKELSKQMSDVDVDVDAKSKKTSGPDRASQFLCGNIVVRINLSSGVMPGAAPIYYLG
jgi:hypothetical protein